MDLRPEFSNDLNRCNIFDGNRYLCSAEYSGLREGFILSRIGSYLEYDDIINVASSVKALNMIRPTMLEKLNK